MNDATLTHIEFSRTDRERAESAAQALGHGKVCNWQNSGLPGLSLNRRNIGEGQKDGGVIINTKEFGLLRIQTLDDLNLSRLA